MTTGKIISSDAIEKMILKQVRNLTIAYRMETKCDRKESLERAAAMLQSLIDILAED